MVINIWTRFEDIDWLILFTFGSDRKYLNHSELWHTRSILRIRFFFSNESLFSESIIWINVQHLKYNHLWNHVVVVKINYLNIASLFMVSVCRITPKFQTENVALYIGLIKNEHIGKKHCFYPKSYLIKNIQIKVSPLK